MGEVTYIPKWDPPPCAYCTYAGTVMSYDQDSDSEPFDTYICRFGVHVPYPKDHEYNVGNKQDTVGTIVFDPGGRLPICYSYTVDKVSNNRHGAWKHIMDVYKDPFRYLIHKALTKAESKVE